MDLTLPVCDTSWLEPSSSEQRMVVCPVEQHPYQRPPRESQGQTNLDSVAFLTKRLHRVALDLSFLPLSCHQYRTICPKTGLSPGTVREDQANALPPRRID